MAFCKSFNVIKRLHASVVRSERRSSIIGYVEIEKQRNFMQSQNMNLILTVNIVSELAPNQTAGIQTIYQVNLL